MIGGYWPGTTPPTTGGPVPQAYIGTEPGYCWWVVGTGEVIGVRIDTTGRAVAIAHGLVGRHLTEDQPLGGLTGYDTWHPLPGAGRREGDWGYWVAHVPIRDSGGGDRP